MCVYFLFKITICTAWLMQTSIITTLFVYLIVLTKVVVIEVRSGVTLKIVVVSTLVT